MRFIQTSIEWPPSSVQDPWYWTVEQVVFALTDDDGQLLRSNASLSMPNAEIFANTLRENEVNGLALLTQVNTVSLRDELGIKSFYQRAAIDDLIGQLQDLSPKFHERAQRLVRLSSVGLGSRTDSPYSTTPTPFELRATPRAQASLLSPVNSSAQSQRHVGLSNPPAQLKYILEEGPELGGPDRPHGLTSCRLEDSQIELGLKINQTEGHSDDAKPEMNMDSPSTVAIGQGEHASNNAIVASNKGQVQHQYETIVVDETGKKRRRLVLIQPDKTGLTKTEAAKSPTFDGTSSSPGTLQKDTKADTSSESNVSITSGYPPLEDEAPVDSKESPVPVEAVMSTSERVHDSVAPAAEPGVISINANGRKRMRPVLVHEVDDDPEDQQFGKPIPRKAADSGSSAPTLREANHPNYMQQRSYGKKAKRKASQVYLGLESMPIDNLIYGDIGLDEDLDKGQAVRESSQLEQPNDLDNFNICPNNNVGKGHRLYVNARLKYFLRGQRIPMERNERKHIGMIPYPDRIGRKNCPLSITVFSPSAHGISASRANRSVWNKDNTAVDATEAGERAGNVFNVADPALACDESEDSEWKALEKWNFVDGKDKVLPLYGDSDSDGEYDLETWLEMEKERGVDIARPLGRSKSAKLPSAEVQGAIDAAIEQIVHDWTLKRLPKLRFKAWRLWTKSRRNRDSPKQIASYTHELEELEIRTAGLREKIAEQEWSKTSQIKKQCNILQPTIFDREDIKWKIDILKLRKAPVKLSLPTKPKVAKCLQLAEAPEDGEEILETNTESCDSSEDDLNDFIIEDDAYGDAYQSMISDDLTMAEAEDDTDSNTLVCNEPKPKTPMKRLQKSSLPVPSPSSVIDLTQLSDTVEPEVFAPKPEFPLAVRTPPLYGSEDDSEIFQRSRKKKAVFKMPPTLPKSPTKTTEVISLESDSGDSKEDSDGDLPNHLPGFDDVEGIKWMESAGLVERQDRRRLLIWMVAHTPARERQVASQYLDATSMEVSRTQVISGLKALRCHKRRLKGMDNEVSDGIMRIATWRVCWTIAVKVTDKGFETPHIITTLEDEDGYEPFYECLLECLQHYNEIPSPPHQKTPRKRRDLIVRQDSDEGLQASQTRKRKYVVPESQQTLDKRHAAQNRFRANEERRRREELKPRFARMSAVNMDSLKVVVNPGKLPSQDFVYLNPSFGNGARIKPHQEEGLQFLWREITVEHDDLQGCLLAQTMGLGKTMQVIALVVTLSEAARSPNENIRNQVPPGLRQSRTLILCPPALVENWWDECLLWPPQPRSDSFGDLRKVTPAMDKADRLSEIHAWSKIGGILLLGYDAFKGFVHNRPRIDATTKEKKAPLDDKQHKAVKRALLDRPTLVVADEAHQFKKKSSSLNQAVNQIRTKSRVALTGSPLNNNLGEYHSVIDWIAPGYLGTYPEFKATYEEPINEGLYQDSTPSQYRESRKRLKALELEMEPKVHRADISCLRAQLKEKSEFVITVPLTGVQHELYGIYAENMRSASRDQEPRVATLWSWLSFLRLLCNHPKCYQKKLLEVVPGSGSSKSAPQKRRESAAVVEEALIGSEDNMAVLEDPVSRVTLSKTKDESLKVFETLADPIDALALSHKTQVLINILEFSQDAHDKVLVFSHSLQTLDYIGEQLLKLRKKYVRIDGKVDPQKRQPMTKSFNEGNINICLISTRAGGQGLNLFGANRVVILDDHFNPMWEQQAVGRAYRIGQQKPVYVYRLTVGGTFEQAIQNQALFKEQLATRVVDKKNPNRTALKGAGQYLFPPKAVNQEDLSQFIGKDPLVLDRLLAAHTQ